MCRVVWLSPRDYFQLLQQRQRLQIGLGDSNMTETAEFLRVGTTALVLDVIEAGEMPPLPRAAAADRGPASALQRSDAGRAACGSATASQ